MTNVVKKLKTNIKNIKNNKLDVIEEMLSLIILFMPFMISIFSIVKFYIENKISLQFSDKAINTYLNGPFWITYICLIFLAIFTTKPIVINKNNNIYIPLVVSFIPLLNVNNLIKF